MRVGDTRYTEFQALLPTWRGRASPGSPTAPTSTPTATSGRGVGWVGQGWDGERRRADRLILLPEICANCVFGGEKHNRLFMASSQSMYAVYVNTHGAHASGT